MENTSPKNLVRYITAILLIMSLGPIMVFSAFWFYNEFAEFNRKTESLKTEFIRTNRQKLKEEVERVMHFIRNEKGRMDSRIVAEIRGKASEAYKLALFTFEQSATPSSPGLTKERVRKALEYIRDSDRSNQLFVINDAGQLLISNSAEPSPVELDFIDHAILLKEDLFYLRGKNDDLYMAYFRWFEPYNWLIVSLRNIDQTYSRLKERLLAQINVLKSMNNQYYFIVDESGLILNGPYAGENAYKVKDDQGNIIREKILALQNTSGDFIEYVLEKEREIYTGNKLSYISYNRALNWYIGTGLLYADLENRIAENRQSLYGKIRIFLTEGLAVLLVLIGIVITAQQIMTRRFGNSLKLLTGFLERAVTHSETLDESTFQFEESRRLIRSMNHMVKGRHKIEQALKKSEAMFKGITENSLDITLILSKENRIVYVNPAFKLYGYDLNDQLDRHIEDYIHPDDLAKITRGLDESKKHPHQAYILGDVLFMTAKRESVHLHITCTYMPETYGINGTVLNCHDVTQRKLNKEALKESEKKFRLLFENLRDGCAETDMNGRFIDVNPSFCNMLGYSKKEILKTDLEKIVPSDPNEIERQSLLNTVISRGFSEIFEKDYIRKDGAILPAEVQLYAVYDNKGSCIAIRSIVRDVTARKKAEEREKRQQQQLLQADKMISLGILTSGVAHEINNPNQFIMTHNTLLRDTWNDISRVLDSHHNASGDFPLNGIPWTRLREKIPLFFENIDKGAKRIKNIVNELKEFAREYPSETPELIEINAVVTSALTLLHHQVKKSTNHFTVNYGKNLPRFNGHYQQLEQVVINLVQNACQSLADKERQIVITTSYKEEKNAISLTVCDEGEGIPQNELKYVTDPFYTTKREIGGTGLGLSISERIISRHGGSIAFDSVEGSGTIATVSIPVKT